MTVEDRFFAKVDAGDCWIWQGAIDRAGYGFFRNEHQVMVKAHRWAWEHLVGPIETGLTIDHLCKNPSCVNPDHLEPVSMLVNLRRGNTVNAINARKVECKYGHPFSPDNTRYKNDGQERVCRTCRNANALRRYHAARAAQK